MARLFATLSILAVIATGVGSIWPGVNLGIDFKGGTVLEFNTGARTADLGKVRDAVSGLNLGDVQVQRFGADNDAVVRFQTPGGADPGAVATKVKGAISGALGQVTVLRTDVVGPEVSGELEWKGLAALLTAVGLMLIYIWFRFELQFGLGAVVALFHDLTLSFGLILLLRLELSLNLVAALLTIIGYSMNDTVVVFDRLRENRRKYKRMSLVDMINLSTNQIATRTTLVSAATALSVIPLLFGGPVLLNFSIAILFGIVVGTFSSTYVAAMLLLYLPAVGSNIETKTEEATV